MDSDNEYFSFENGIIKVKIDSDMSNRTMSEVYKIEHLFNNVLPSDCYVDIDNMIMYFVDPWGDKYRIEECFDTTIY